MAPKSRHLKFERLIQAPLVEVYRAFTNSTALREWLCDAAQADPRPNGRLYLWWNSGYSTSGRFITVEPNQRIVFTWHGSSDPGDTEVEVDLADKGGATQVTLRHTKVKARGTWIKFREEIQRGWEIGLENLASVLETGQDLRIVRRPMLGISVGDFDAEKAAQLGVLVNEGIRLDSVVEGLGAQAAGLQKDDVIVSIGGAAVKGYPDLVNALQGRQAGDKVEVVFYRGEKINIAIMELSRRPIPEIPMSPALLAEAVRKVYADVDEELNKTLVGVTETEASYNPASGEWNVKEVLAHLIHGERFLLGWISELVGGNERVADNYGGNNQAQVTATVRVYPTTAELLAELKRTQSEIVAFVSVLPDEFRYRRGSYWRVGYTLVEGSIHIRSHNAQIINAIAAARLVS
jgi:uncharacterized protein YndB with AHSA1/START domain